MEGRGEPSRQQSLADGEPGPQWCLTQRSAAFLIDVTAMVGAPWLSMISKVPITPGPDRYSSAAATPRQIWHSKRRRARQLRLPGPAFQFNDRRFDDRTIQCSQILDRRFRFTSCQARPRDRSR